MRDTGQGMFEGEGFGEVSREHSPERRVLERGSSGLGHGSRRCGAVLLHLQTLELH